MYAMKRYTNTLFLFLFLISFLFGHQLLTHTHNNLFVLLSPWAVSFLSFFLLLLVLQEREREGYRLEVGWYGLSGGRVQKLRDMGLKLFIIFYRFVFFTCLQPRHGGGFLENQNLFVGLLIWEATHEPFKEIKYFERHLFFFREYWSHCYFWCSDRLFAHSC